MRNYKSRTQLNDIFEHAKKFRESKTIVEAVQIHEEMSLSTENGPLSAYSTDWIVKDKHGDFDVYTDESFKKTFDLTHDFAD